MPPFLKLLLLAGCVLLPCTSAIAADDPPNILIFYLDDLGYADIDPFGGEYGTPNFTRLANEGIKLTSFYASAPICSPSRASLLTGCYPPRVDINKVLRHRQALHQREETMAELLKEAGYETAMVGKWHLGGGEVADLPISHGFDSWFGSPVSNGKIKEGVPEPDMEQFFLFENDKIVDRDPSNDTIVKRYTERAVEYLKQDHEKPFLLYFAHNQPHTPIGASEAFRNSGPGGLYGDTIRELDWSLGQVLDTLDETGLAENTFVIFSSDNGPWLLFGDHGGSADPLRGGKKETFEGGMRVAGIMRYPGRLPAGETRDQLVAQLDILPTVLALADAPKPEKKIDGLNQWAYLSGESPKTARDTFYYYNYGTLYAVRSGKWKLQLGELVEELHDPDGIKNGGLRGSVIDVEKKQALYNLEADISETTDVQAKHPEVLAELLNLAEAARRELGDDQQKIEGTGVRPAQYNKGKTTFDTY